MFLNSTLDTQQSSGALSGEGAGLHREAWERVMRRLRAELGDDVFSSWFGRLELVDLAGDVAHLTVPTRFLKSWIQSHYIERVLTLLTEEFSAVCRIDLSVRGTTSRLSARAGSKPQVEQHSSVQLLTTLRRRRLRSLKHALFTTPIRCRARRSIGA